MSGHPSVTGHRHPSSAVFDTAPGDSPAIVVDAMGGDHAPDAVVDGALVAAREGVRVVLVGDEPAIRARWDRDVPVEVVHADDVIGMGERPRVVRSRVGASVRVAAARVAEGQGHALVSCGNSGATLVASVLALGKLEGVDRPAIATSLPRLDGGTLHLVDVGTTTDATARHLLSFARLGDARARIDGVSRPRIGLLSNGSEPGKGNRLVQEATALLQGCELNFVGPVEPTAAFEGAADVLVSDGFNGNILIKTAEAVIGMLRVHATRRVQASRRARAGAWLMKDALRQLREDVDWRARGGALLLGVPAPVVVAHGRSDAMAVRAAIGLAHYAIEARLIDAVQGALRPSTGSTGSSGGHGGPSLPPSSDPSSHASSRTSSARPLPGVASGGPAA